MIFVIIDSPPVGLVADSFELMELSDANIYVVRHEYTEKYAENDNREISFWRGGKFRNSL